MTDAPLKNLSFLSMETIVGYMDAGKLFEVSIKSESFNKFLETIKVPAYEILFEVAEHGLVDIYCCIGYWLSFNCMPMQNINGEITGRINGKTMTLQKSISGEYDYALETLTIVEMEDIASHLLRIFKPEKLNLRLTACSSAMNCLDWKMPWNRMSIGCTYEYFITPEDLRRVFEHERVTEISLRFYYPRRDSEGFELDDNEREARGLEFIRQTRDSLLDIPKLIKCEKFECDVFDFISVEDLINSQCKIINLNNQLNPLTNSEINRFLKAWKTGEHMTNLKEMSIYDPYKTYNSTLEIREGIELHDEYPTHPMFIERYSDDFADDGGLVIKRETDNVLATCWITSFSITFVVWNFDEEEEKEPTGHLPIEI